jgi:hypothetical protein
MQSTGYYCQILIKSLIFLDRFSKEETLKIKFYENLSHADGRTDGQTYMKMVVALHNF